MREVIKNNENLKDSTVFETETHKIDMCFIGVDGIHSEITFFVDVKRTDKNGGYWDNIAQFWTLSEALKHIN